MATRSVQLAAVRVAATGWSNFYVQPGPGVVILKTINVVSWASSPGQVTLQISAGSDSAQIRLLNESLDNSQFKELSTWIVLEPGDIIAAYLGMVPVDIVLSGAELPPRPGVALTDPIPRVSPPNG